MGVKGKHARTSKNANHIAKKALGAFLAMSLAAINPAYSAAVQAENAYTTTGAVFLTSSIRDVPNDGAAFPAESNIDESSVFEGDAGEATEGEATEGEAATGGATTGGAASGGNPAEGEVAKGEMPAQQPGESTARQPGEVSPQPSEETPALQPDESPAQPSDEDPAAEDSVDSTTPADESSLADLMPAESQLPDTSAASPAGQESLALAVMGDGSYDLMSLWRAAPAGLSGPLTITSGGIYRLSEDLTTKFWIDIKAPGENVVIDFGTNSIIVEQDNKDYFVNVEACNRFTIRGSRPFAGVQNESQPATQQPLNQLTITKGRMLKAIVSSANNTSVENIGISMAGHKEYASLRNLNACGLYVVKGEAEVVNSSIAIDHSIQTLREASAGRIEGFPKAIMLSGDASILQLNNTALEVKGSIAAARFASSPYTLTTCDNAYGVYSEGAARVKMTGGSISVSSPPGYATGILAASTELVRQEVSDAQIAGVAAESAKDALRAARYPSFFTSAKYYEFAVHVSGKPGLTVDTPLSFNSSEAAECIAAIRADAANAVILKSGFTGIANLQGLVTNFSPNFPEELKLPVAVGATLESANSKWCVLASLDSAYPGAMRNQAPSAFCNATNGDGCYPMLEGNSILFTIQDSKAPIHLVKADGSLQGFASLSAALNEAGRGDIVKLQKNPGRIVISEEMVPAPKASSDNYGRLLTIDLNGFNASDVLVATSEPVKLFSSTTNKASISGFSLTNNASLLYQGTGGLTLENLSIVGYSTSVAGAALLLEGSGPVVIDKCTIAMHSQAVYSRGIYQTGLNGIVSIKNSSITATSEAAGVTVRGVEVVPVSSKVHFEATSVSAQSYNASAGAIECSGSISTSSLGRCSFVGKSRIAASTVFAIQAYNSNAEVTLYNASVKALCGSEPGSGNYWCLMAGSSAPAFESQWSLDGQCDFESAKNTHIGFRKKPIRLGASFSLVGATAKLRILGTYLVDGAAFESESASAPRLAAYASMFEAVPLTTYADYSLKVKGTCLSWYKEPIIQNTTTGAEFANLEDAVLSAQSGDRLKLLRDARHIGNISSGKPIVLDLNNKKLSLVTPSNHLSGKQNAALALKGAGNYTIENGTLEVTVQPNSLSLWAGVEYSVILASGSSNLSISGATLKFDYETSISSANALVLSGIKTSGANLALAEGSSVAVSCDAAHPVVTRALYFNGEDETKKLAVDNSVNIQLTNNSVAAVQGSITTENQLNSFKTAYLSEFSPEKDSALYKEIQEKFLLKAFCDVSNDSAGHVYNSGMYYATPVSLSDGRDIPVILSDGRYIWAYSAPIAPENIGKKEYIKADKFYAQTYYDALPVSIAVALKGEAPCVTFGGKANVACPNGEALGLAPVDLNSSKDIVGSSGGVSGSAMRGANILLGREYSLRVSGSSTPFRKIGDLLDMRKVYGFDNSSIVMYPPYYNVNKLVTLEAPQNIPCAVSGVPACAYSAANSGVSTGADTATYSGVAACADTATYLESDSLVGPVALPQEPPKAYPDLAKLKFADLRSADAKLLGIQECTLPYGAKLDTVSIPQGQDYSQHGINFRFLGYRVNHSTYGNKIWPIDALKNLVADDSIVDKSGSVTISAVYTDLVPGQHRVVFCVGDTVQAYGAYSGETPDYRRVVAGASSTIPGDESGSYYEDRGFVGWQAIASLQGSSAGAEGSTVFTSSLPRVTGDVIYKAKFNSYPNKISNRYFTWRQQGAALAYSYSVVESLYGQDSTSSVWEIGKAGDVKYGEDVVYTLTGWSVRSSDREPVYGEEAPMPTASGNAYYATYDERPRLIKVIFHVDNTPYVTTQPLVGTTTINGAFYTGNQSKPADRGLQNRFRGWSLEPEGGTLLMGAVRNLASLTTAEEPINLYALFGSGPVDGEEEDNTEFLGLGIFAAGAPPALAAAAAMLPGLGALGLPLAEQPLAAEGVEAAQKSVVSEDSATPTAGTGVNPEFGQADSLSAMIVLGALGCAILGIVGGVAYSARRNRKLDKLDDFYEAAPASKGEQLVF